jgi:hypothetical protein
MKLDAEDANERILKATKKLHTAEHLLRLALIDGGGWRQQIRDYFQAQQPSLAGRTLTGAELLECLGFPAGFSVSVNVPGGGDWSNVELAIDDETPLCIRDRRHRMVQK